MAFNFLTWKELQLQERPFLLALPIGPPTTFRPKLWIYIFCQPSVCGLRAWAHNSSCPGKLQGQPQTPHVASPGAIKQQFHYRRPNGKWEVMVWVYGPVWKRRGRGSASDRAVHTFLHGWETFAGFPTLAAFWHLGKLKTPRASKVSWISIIHI